MSVCIGEMTSAEQLEEKLTKVNTKKEGLASITPKASKLATLPLF